MFEGVHLDRPLATKRGQALGLVERLTMVPCHLQHDLATIAIDARRDPRAVAAGLKRLIEGQPPKRGQRHNSVWKRGQPLHSRWTAEVGRSLHVSRHPQLRSHATYPRALSSEPPFRPVPPSALLCRREPTSSPIKLTPVSLWEASHSGSIRGNSQQWWCESSASSLPGRALEGLMKRRLRRDRVR